MGRELHTYDKYQDSGVEWIGKIPQEWEVRQVKTLAENLDNRRIPVSAENREDGKYPYWGAAGIVDYINDFIFDGEYVLVGEDGAPFFDKSKKVSFTTQGKFWVNNHTHILEPRKGCDSRWLAYFLNTNDYKMYIKGSTRDKLDQSTLSRIVVSLPPLQTQRTIADYLDRETGDIDQLIAKDRQLIKLLQERRQSLIYHTVTGKIDTNGQPTTNLKDSGVEWIGKIPQEWEILKLKRESNIYSGGTPSRDEISFWENGTIPWIGSKEVNQGEVEHATAYITKEAFHKSSTKWIEKNSLIIALAGQGKTKGMVAVMRKRMTGNQSLGVIEPSKRVVSKYWFYLLKSCYLELRGISGEGSRDGLNLNMIGDFQVLLPPLQTQRTIADYLDKKTASIDQAISKIQKRIDHLAEYRQSLIYHVVTGKVKAE